MSRPLFHSEFIISAWPSARMTSSDIQGSVTMKIAIASDHAGFPLMRRSATTSGSSATRFECVESSLNAKFIATEEHFVRRLVKVKAIEKQYMPATAATALTT